MPRQPAIGRRGSGLLASVTVAALVAIAAAAPPTVDLTTPGSPESISASSTRGLGSLLGWATRHATGEREKPAPLDAARLEELRAHAALLHQAMEEADGGASALLQGALEVVAGAGGSSDPAALVAAFESIEEAVGDLEAASAFHAGGGLAAAGRALARGPPAVAHAAAGALATACRNNPPLQAAAASSAPLAAASLARAAAAGSADPARAARALTALSALCLGPPPAGDACVGVDAVGLTVDLIKHSGAPALAGSGGRGRGRGRASAPLSDGDARLAARAAALMADLGAQDAANGASPDPLARHARDEGLATALAAHLSAAARGAHPRGPDAAAAATDALLQLCGRPGGPLTAAPHAAAAREWAAAARLGGDDRAADAAEVLRARLAAAGGRDEL